MAESNTNRDAFDFSDAPDQGMNLDDIFGENSSAPTTTEINPNPQPTTTETTPSPTEPFIKTKTGTVYKSIDDAVQGIEVKDTLIAQLREQVKQQTGADPLAARKPASTPQPVGPKSYIEDQEKYFEDIADAVAKKDTKAYMNAQDRKSVV